jgi:hypothetical protein
MTDPKRLTEANEGSDGERELLLAGRAARLPESDRRALWASIALSLPSVGTSSPGRGPVTAAPRLSPYLTKGLILLGAVTGLSLGASQLWPSAPLTARSTPSLARPPLATHPLSSSVEPTPVVAPEPAVAPSVTPSDARARPTTSSQLREESVAILEARSALRAGDPARSLTLLEQARVRFPRGALGQEREALTIQALAQSGEHASARRRAVTFLRAHPQSPYVADVRLLATP